MSKQPVEKYIPDDIFRPIFEPREQWKTLDQQTLEATMKKVDMIGQMVLEERSKGQQGCIERVQLALGLEGEKKAKNTIGTYTRIFEVIRLAPPYGLGMSRTEIVQADVSVRRLRAVAQNHKWAKANPDKVRKVLLEQKEDGKFMGEEEIRKFIAEDEGRTTQEKSIMDWQNKMFRMTKEDAELMEYALKAVEAKAVMECGINLPESEAVRRSHLLMFLVADWLGYGDMVEDGKGGKVRVPNSIYAPDEAMGKKYTEFLNRMEVPGTNDENDVLNDLMGELDQHVQAS